jgi:hypothetical protein
MKTETVKAARAWWWSENLCDRSRECPRERDDELDHEEAKGERLGGEKVGGWWW